MFAVKPKWVVIGLTGLVWFIVPGWAVAQDDWRDRLEVSSILEFSLAVETDRGAVQKSETVYTPELKFDVTDILQLTAIVRIRGDASDKLEPDQPGENTRDAMTRRLFVGGDLDVELREFYADIDMDKVFLRLGKQQIVWGEADGLKVLDVLNPQSFREFILPEFEDSRIPLWTANAEISIGEESTVQLVWIPDQTYNDIPDQHATYAFTSPKLVPQAPAGVPVTIQDTNRPKRFFADSDLGVRASTFVKGWELSFSYFYHYFDTPVLRRSLGSSSINITPEYERTHLVGTTFNNAFGDWVLRGEIGYSTDRFFLSQDPADNDGVVASGEFSYVLGMDYQGITDTFISAQFFQTVITDYEHGIIQDCIENSFTFLFERKFLNETLIAELLAIHNINDGDGVIQTELSYQIRSNIDLKLGIDMFYGSREGLFGQFANKDRVTFGIVIGF